VTRLVPFTSSWDDGFSADLKLAELLTEHGLLGTFYASTGPSGSRSISDDDLAKIGINHELGNHGRTHRRFPELSDDEIRLEVVWAEEAMRSFGSLAPVVAPPAGKMDSRVIRVIHDAGYWVRSSPVLATASRRVAWIEPSFQFYPHDWKAVARNMGRRGLIPALPLVRAWARGADFRNRAHLLVRTAIARMPQVHIWGHSWELDHLGLWDTLDDLLRTVKSLPIRPMTNGDLAREGVS
jgi:peptidoglycan/xylan/chitin deacetylase (PgdA/CDA1 family)